MKKRVFFQLKILSGAKMDDFIIHNFSEYYNIESGTLSAELEHSYKLHPISTIKSVLERTEHFSQTKLRNTYPLIQELLQLYYLTKSIRFSILRADVLTPEEDTLF